MLILASGIDLDNQVTIDNKYPEGSIGNMSGIVGGSINWTPLLETRLLPPHLHGKLLSQQRARMAVMRQDPINAALWSLSGYDPALIHFAELRERVSKNTKLSSADEELEVALDRALSVYLESQNNTLQQAAGVDLKELNTLIGDRLGDGVNTTSIQAIALTHDPLILELFGYALRLGVLTGHSDAPWRRFAAVMAECFEQKHPDVKVTA